MLRGKLITVKENRTCTCTSWYTIGSDDGRRPQELLKWDYTKETSKKGYFSGSQKHVARAEENERTIKNHERETTSSVPWRGSHSNGDKTAQTTDVPQKWSHSDTFMILWNRFVWGLRPREKWLTYEMNGAGRSNNLPWHQLDLLSVRRPLNAALSPSKLTITGISVHERASMAFIQACSTESNDWMAAEWSGWGQINVRTPSLTAFHSKAMMASEPEAHSSGFKPLPGRDKSRRSEESDVTPGPGVSTQSDSSVILYTYMTCRYT